MHRISTTGGVMIRRATLTLALLLAAGCGDDAGPSDASMDAAPEDARMDAAPPDARPDAPDAPDAAPEDGGPPDADAGLAPGPIVTGLDRPTGIAFGDGRLYWSTERAGTVSACDPRDCEATVSNVVSGLTTPRGLSVHAGVLYFVSEAGVQSCPVAGCAGTPTDVMTATGSRPSFDVAVDGARIVATRFPDLLFECAFPACADPSAVSGVFLGQGMSAVALSPSDIFVTRWGTRRVTRCPVDTDCTMTEDTVVGDVRGASGVAVDDTHVYWSTSSYQDGSPGSIAGTIARCPIAGCADSPETLLDTADIEPFGVALDGRAVYWTDFVAGTVNRLLVD